MKKSIISILAVIALLATLIPSTVMAAATNGTTDGWSGDDNDIVDTVLDTVDGVEKPVLKWNWNGESVLKADLGKMPEGYYEIYLKAKADVNIGTGRLGLGNDANGGFPGNCDADRSFPRGSDYSVARRIVEVSSNLVDVENTFRIHASYGAASGNAYIAEAAVRQIAYNADGETYYYTGANLIKNDDFVASNISDTVDNWSVGGGAHSFEASTYNNVDTLEWSWTNNGDKYLSYAVDTSEAGIYEATVEFYMTGNNAGTHSINLSSYTSGIGNGAGAFPANSGQYHFVVKQLYVIEENKTTATNSLNFHNGWGEPTGSIYFTKISVKRIGDLPRTKEPPVGTTAGWSGDDNDIVDTVLDTVDGVEKPVLKWNWNGESILKADLGKMPEGYYEIYLKAKADVNIGTGRLGLGNDANGGFPSNADADRSFPRGSDYSVARRIVEVSSNLVDVENTFRIHASYGAESGNAYIAEAAVRKIAYNADGETYHYTSANLIKNDDFVISNITEAPENWSVGSGAHSFDLSTYTADEQEIEVLEWSWTNNGDKYLSYAVDTSEAGIYEATVEFYMTGNNAGTHSIDLSKYTSGVGNGAGAFPANSGQYHFVVKQLYVIEEDQATADNAINFHNGWGEPTGSIYFKKLNFKRIGDVPVLPEEPEIGTMEGWECGESDTMELVMDTVGDIEKPVLKWTYKRKEGSSLWYDLGGTLARGTYEITAYVKSPNNSGVGNFGIYRDEVGGFPSNSEDKQLIPSWNNEYTRISRQFTIGDASVGTNQSIRFYTAYGDAPGTLFVSDISLKVVNPDGTVSAYNRVDNVDFTLDQTKPPVKGSLAGWDSDTISLEYDMVNGYEKPVMKWDYLNGGGSTLYYTIGKMEPGDYEIAMTVYSPNNVGEGFVGLLNDSNGGFPDNSKTRLIPWHQNGLVYETVKKTVTVDAGAGHGCDIINKLGIKSGWGDNGSLWISDISIRPITYTDETTYEYAGENIVENPDFSVDKFTVSDMKFDIVDEAGDSVLTEECTFIPMIPFEELGYQMIFNANIMNAQTTNATPTLFVAVYDDGKLYDLTAVSSTLAAGTEETWEAYVKLPAEITGTITAKAFVWDTDAGMTPISDVFEIAAQEF